MATNINEYLDRIERMSSIHPVTLDDYPSSNRVAQTIAERVDAIIHSLTTFRGNVKEKQVNVIIESIWAMDATDSSSFKERIWGMELETPIKIKEGNQIKTIKELADTPEEPKDETAKKIFLNLKEKYKDCSNTVEQSFLFFKNVWALINADGGLLFKSDKPTIKQIYQWSNLIPPTKPIDEQVDIPGWDSLCEKLRDCFCPERKKCNWCCVTILGLSIILIGVVAWSTLSNLQNILGIDLIDKAKWLHYIFVIVIIAAILVFLFLLLNKINLCQSKRHEADNKLTEKMIDAVINAFNEDREYGRLRRKAEIALKEKLEKARIDEWCRNKENERKINYMEQDRISELSNVLKELAKTKNTVTFKGSLPNGKTITIERSILSNDCCNEIKDVTNSFVNHNDDCCDLIKKIINCIDGDTEENKRNKRILRSIVCDKDWSEEFKKLIEELKAKCTSTGSNGVQQVVNINGAEKVSTNK